MVERFLNELRQQGKSDLTVKQYRSSLQKFERWLLTEGGYTRGSRGPADRRKGREMYRQNFKTSGGNGFQRNSGESPSTIQGSSPIIHATQLDIANFKRWASQNYKPRTVQLNLIQLSVFFKWLVGLGEIPDNPCQHISPVTVQQEAPKWLERNEQNMLIRVVRKHGDQRELSIITLLLHTGIRVQELCNLRLGDVYLSDRKGHIVIQSGKGGKYREVPLNFDARKTIEDWHKVRKGGLVNSETDMVFLFHTQRSEQMTTRAVQFIFQKYSRITGLTVTPHVLRHTFGHELAVRKIPLDVIARLMGHMKRDGSPNLDMVTRYTIPGNGDLERAVEELAWK
jgi:integrase/recombinase XerC/integrase/recombinase XerD